MSTMTAAIIAALVYWVIYILDTNFLSWQTLTRPIVIAPIIGLLLGDPVTGIIMGASLESIFMGISAIGGSIPSDPTSASIIAVTYTILTGSDAATGLAIAMPIGTVMSSVSGLLMSLWSMLAPYWEKLAISGKPKKFMAQVFFVGNVLMPIPSVLILFFGIAYGVTGLQSFLASLPAFVMTGLGAASGMMIGVGFAILMSMIWSGSVGCFFFVGFIMAKLLNLSSLAIAILGAAIAITYFFAEKNVVDLKNSLKTSSNAVQADNDEEGFF